MIWLEEYHINNYIKKYDGRSEGRYLNPPKIRGDFKIGDRVVISPQGRFKSSLEKSLIGKVADITGFNGHEHPVAGRYFQVTLLNGKTWYVSEINLRFPLDKP